MANLAGVVQLLKKEHGRLTKELQGISAALAAFGNAYGKRTGTRRETLGSRTGTNSGSATSALGKSEGKQESEPKWKRCSKASDIRSGPQEDGSRATCSMGQSEGGKEGGVDHWA